MKLYLPSFVLIITALLIPCTAWQERLTPLQEMRVASVRQNGDAAEYKIMRGERNIYLALGHDKTLRIIVVYDDARSIRAVAIKPLFSGEKDSAPFLLEYRTSEQSGPDDLVRNVLDKQFIAGLPAPKGSRRRTAPSDFAFIGADDYRTRAGVLPVQSFPIYQPTSPIAKLADKFCGNVNIDSPGAHCSRQACKTARCFDGLKNFISRHEYDQEYRRCKEELDTLRNICLLDP